MCLKYNFVHINSNYQLTQMMLQTEQEPNTKQESPQQMYTEQKVGDNHQVLLNVTSIMTEISKEIIVALINVLIILIMVKILEGYQRCLPV